MSSRRGAQFASIGMPTVCWKTFPAKTTKILSTRNSSILMVSSSEYLSLESECSITKYVSACPNTIYLYLRLPFFNDGVSNNASESVFQFLLRYGCIKGWKIKRLYACYLVESWSFKKCMATPCIYSTEDRLLVQNIANIQCQCPYWRI